MEQFIEDDSQGPNISLESLRLALEYFKGHVVIGSTKTFSVLICGEVVGPAEIRNLWIQLII